MKMRQARAGTKKRLAALKQQAWHFHDPPFADSVTKSATGISLAFTAAVWPRSEVDLR
jgi:hypothetical protein